MTSFNEPNPEATGSNNSHIVDGVEEAANRIISEIHTLSEIS